MNETHWCIERNTLQEQAERDDFCLTVYRIGGAILGVVRAVFTCVLQKGR